MFHFKLCNKIVVVAYHFLIEYFQKIHNLHFEVIKNLKYKVLLCKKSNFSIDFESTKSSLKNIWVTQSSLSENRKNERRFRGPCRTIYRLYVGVMLMFCFLYFKFITQDMLLQWTSNQNGISTVSSHFKEALI